MKRLVISMILLAVGAVASTPPQTMTMDGFVDLLMPRAERAPVAVFSGPLWIWLCVDGLPVAQATKVQLAYQLWFAYLIRGGPVQ